MLYNYSIAALATYPLATLTYNVISLSPPRYRCRRWYRCRRDDGATVPAATAVGGGATVLPPLSVRVPVLVLLTPLLVVVVALLPPSLVPPCWCRCRCRWW